MRWLKDPTVQFIILFPIPILIGLTGTTIGGLFSPLSVLIASLLLCVATARSLRYELREYPFWKAALKRIAMEYALVPIVMLFIFSLMGIIFAVGSLSIQLIWR